MRHTRTSQSPSGLLSQFKAFLFEIMRKERKHKDILTRPVSLPPQMYCWHYSQENYFVLCSRRGSKLEEKTENDSESLGATQMPNTNPLIKRRILHGQVILHHDLTQSIFTVVSSSLLTHVHGYHRNKECTVLFWAPCVVLQLYNSANLCLLQQPQKCNIVQPAIQ